MDIWEITLKLKNPVRLIREFPYIDIPIPSSSLTGDFLRATFVLSDRQAESLSLAFSLAKCVAIDSPPDLASEDRRSSELRWHNHMIKGIKPKKGGIFWTPSKHDMYKLLGFFFSSENRCQLTTEQITTLGQSLWMFVGFWSHKAFKLAKIPTIEVFPAALRAVCQHIAASEQAEELDGDFQKWGGISNFSKFISSKSETNDAGISCFAAYLWSCGKTEELHPNEIVVPLNRACPFGGPIAETQKHPNNEPNIAS